MEIFTVRFCFVFVYFLLAATYCSAGAEEEGAYVNNYSHLANGENMCVSPIDFKQLQDRVVQLEKTLSNYPEALQYDLHDIPQRIEIISNGLEANDEEASLNQLNYVYTHILKFEVLQKFSKSLWAEIRTLSSVNLNQKINFITSLSSPSLSLHFLAAVLQDTDANNNGQLQNPRTLEILLEAFKSAAENSSPQIILNEETESNIVRVSVRNLLQAFPDTLEDSKIVQDWVDLKDNLNQMFRVSFQKLSEVQVEEIAVNTLETIGQNKTLSIKEMDLLMTIYYASSPLSLESYNEFSARDYQHWIDIFSKPFILNSLEADLKSRVFSSTSTDILRIGKIYLENVWGYFRKQANTPNDILYANVVEMFLEAIQNGTIPHNPNNSTYFEFVQNLLQNPSLTLPSIVSNFPFLLNDTSNAISTKYANKRENIRSALEFAAPLVNTLKVLAITQLISAVKQNDQFNGKEAFQTAKFMLDSNLTELSLWNDIPEQARILTEAISNGQELFWGVIVNGSSSVKNHFDISLQKDSLVGLIPEEEFKSSNSVWIFRTKQLGSELVSVAFTVENYETFLRLLLKKQADGVERLQEDNSVEGGGAYEVFEPHLSQSGDGFYISAGGKFIQILRNHKGTPVSLCVSRDVGERALFSVTECTSC